MGVNTETDGGFTDKYHTRQRESESSPGLSRQMRRCFRACVRARGCSNRVLVSLAGSHIVTALRLLSQGERALRGDDGKCQGAGGSQAGVHGQCQALCAPRGTGTLSSRQAPVQSCEHRGSSQHAHVHAQYGHTVSTCTFGSLFYPRPAEDVHFASGLFLPIMKDCICM